MIWLNPAAWLALAAVAAPVLIHILVQRRAERVPFPTLRFLRPTRLTAIRRHLLDDPLLLVVRSAIVVAAVAAVAGPLLVTAARRDAWSRRIVRAAVVSADTPLAANGPPPFRAREFRGPSLTDGIRRAIDWLDHAPPARRELLIVAPLTIGSLSAADLAAVPPDVGIAFERAGTLPAARTVPYGTVQSAAGTVVREATLTGARTSVRDVSTTARAGADALPIDVVATAAARPFVDAAIAAVVSQRVWTPPPDRRARLIVVEAGNQPTLNPELRTKNPDPRTPNSEPRTPNPAPWMADAIARLTRDADLQQAAARSPGALADARFPAPPWRTIAMAGDGRPLIVAGAQEGRLTIVSGAPASDLVTPLVVRALVNAMAVTPDLTPLEIVGLPDDRLKTWSRPAAAPASPRIDSVDGDDRRWLWLAALGLLALETWLRRSRRDRATAADEERVRVA